MGLLSSTASWPYLHVRTSILKAVPVFLNQLFFYLPQSSVVNLKELSLITCLCGHKRGTSLVGRFVVWMWWSRLPDVWRVTRSVAITCSILVHHREVQQMRVPVVTSWESWKRSKGRSLNRLRENASGGLAYIALWRKALQKIGG